MTITPRAGGDATESAPPGRRRLRWWWISFGVVLIVVIAGAVTGTVVYRHYADAPSLDVEGGVFRALPGPHGTYRDASVGTVAITEIQVDRHQQQGFEIWVHNPSSVTQRVLGLSPASCCTAEPDELLVSTRDPATGSETDGRFVTPPVDIPPGGFRAVRFLTTINECWVDSRSNTYTDLYLRVRVGALTRDEDVPFSSEMTVVIAQTWRNRCQQSP